MTHPLLQSKGNKPRKGKVLECVICGTEFYRQQALIVTDNPTCSNACRHLLGRKRILLDCSECEQPYEVPRSTYDWSLKRGHKRTYCSKKCQIKGSTGEKSPLYLKDRTQVKCRPNGNIDHKKWREEVFKRDNYTCQDCKKRGGALEAHHIYTWASTPELRTNIHNGITLCKKCHNKTKNKEWRFIPYYAFVVGLRHSVIKNASS